MKTVHFKIEGGTKAICGLKTGFHDSRPQSNIISCKNCLKQLMICDELVEVKPEKAFLENLKLYVLAPTVKNLIDERIKLL